MDRLEFQEINRAVIASAKPRADFVAPLRDRWVLYHHPGNRAAIRATHDAVGGQAKAFRKIFSVDAQDSPAHFLGSGPQSKVTV